MSHTGEAPLMRADRVRVSRKAQRRAGPASRNRPMCASSQRREPFLPPLRPCLDWARSAARRSRLVPACR
jgi:hypothetical protein